ncbi:unnamed protein product [Rhizophagus irregularis]|nr:unnamed protein product [Rhizophagus irregularis]
MSNSISQVVLHLLSKNGPQTSKQLLSHINGYRETISHKYLKSKVLDNMKNQDLIHKKIYRGDSNDPKSSKIKPLWLWNINENKLMKFEGKTLANRNFFFLFSLYKITIFIYL